ncbi:CNKR1 kinase, partial [Glareola pratincola]|nr:CNKR1 kinase [Glareola pratincola]
MAQKWKRCWFVLKGHALYWYHHPNDEKAAGLINVATYDLESTREQKKKYVFQLSHQRYKPFIFAAETLADLSMWVSHLVTAKTKYVLAHQSVPDREEGNGPLPGVGDGAGSPVGVGDPTGSCGMGVPGGSRTWRCGPCTGPLGALPVIRGICPPAQGQPPQKPCPFSWQAKLEELQALEQLLSDVALTSEKFTRWKEEHQELREWWARHEGQDPDGRLGAERSPPEEAAEP